MNKIRATFQLILAVIFWGISFVATKVALEEVQPVTIIWLRFGIGLAVLGFTVQIRHQWQRPAKKDLGYLALLGFIGITFHQWLQSTALVTTQATTTAWIVATTPVFMALLGWLALHEKLAGMQFLGISLAVAGVFLVVSMGDFSSLSLGSFGTGGDWLVLISALNWAIFSVLSRRGLQKYPPSRLIFYIMLVGWFFSSIPFLTGPGFTDIGKLTVKGWTSILFLGVFCSGLAYIFWYDGLEVMPVAQVGAFLYLEPFITLVFAAFILAEPLLLVSFIGGVLILMGVWIVQTKGKKALEVVENA